MATICRASLLRPTFSSFKPTLVPLIREEGKQVVQKRSHGHMNQYVTVEGHRTKSMLSWIPLVVSCACGTVWAWTNALCKEVSAVGHGGKINPKWRPYEHLAVRRTKLPFSEGDHSLLFGPHNVTSQGYDTHWKGHTLLWRRIFLRRKRRRLAMGYVDEH